MVKLQARAFHKWLGIGTGLVLGVWLISGVVLVTPRPTPNFMAFQPAQQIDLQSATLSPADVVALYAQDGREVAAVSLRVILGRVRYEVRDAAGAVDVVDAATGAPLRLSENEARALLASRLRDGVTTNSPKRIEEHSFGYPYGELPAFAFGIDGSLGATVYVTERGSIVPLDLAGKVWLGITSLHTLAPLTPLLGNQGRRLFMAGVGSLACILVVTGFWLTLPMRRRRQKVWKRSASAGPS